MAHDKQTVRAAYAAVTTLFFAWGFITSMIDPLVAAVKGIFALSTAEAAMSASAFFIAYGLVSLPAAMLLARIGSIPSILSALVTMIVGCVVMLGAANLAVYPLVMLGLFILASGITVLQVAANPLAAALGEPRLSHFRLTLAQAFNSLGTFAGPLIGASLFLRGLEVKEGTVITEEVRNRALEGIDTAYFWIAALIAMLVVFFYLSRRVVAQAAANVVTAEARPLGLGATLRDALSSRWAVLGGAAIFLYVGAEVAIGTQMAFFLNDDGVWGISLEQAARITAYYWGGAMVGRLIGSVGLARVPAARMLAAFTATAAALSLYAGFVGGANAGYAALAIGFFNSIMFPVIFTLTLERSSASAEATSGLLCTAIVGGAVIPYLTGLLADRAGYVTALVLPGACYVLLCGFALAAGRQQPIRTATSSALH